MLPDILILCLLASQVRVTAVQANVDQASRRVQDEEAKRLQLEARLGVRRLAGSLLVISCLHDAMNAGNLLA